MEAVLSNVSTPWVDITVSVNLGIAYILTMSLVEVSKMFYIILLVIHY